MDLRKTIIPNSNQVNADDLIGGSKTIRIRDVEVLDSETQPVSIFFDGDENKPYKPSKGMRRVLVAIWGADAKAFIGRSLTLYRDDKVKFGGLEVGGIRISHASHIDNPVRVLETVSRGKRKPMTINPIVVEKKPLSDERFQKALVALEQGKTTIEKLMEYDLTEEQLKQLNK